MTGAPGVVSAVVPESRLEPTGSLVSVIVPVIGQPDDLSDLYREYSAPFRSQGREFEFIFAAGPPCANLVRRLAGLIAAGEPVRALVVQAFSEATLLRVGATASRGTVIITLPPFRRVQSHALPELLRPIDDGVDFVAARRWPRRDVWMSRVQAWVFHEITKTLRAEPLHDVSCGVTAMRRDVVNELPLYGDLFRFLPILALGAGFSVAEVDAPQHPADQRARLHHPGVYVRRLVDVMGLFFLVRFTEKPLRFFGLIGAACLVPGSAILLLLFAQRLMGRGVADRPLMILGVLFIVLGVQALGLGLVGEIIVHLHIRRTRRYRIVGTPPPDPRPVALQAASADDNGSRSTPGP